MKVVGNCPQCGNPIWASGPEVTKRTCFCVTPIPMQPITVQPQPQRYGPVSPWVSPLTVGDGLTPYTPSRTATANTFHAALGGVVGFSGPRPPDEDGALVV